uniref:Uncharacterized protein n=1 Tax=Nelumbo nucifera TaxID=4432 RepID=A0A822XK74_NELNU|nr:TPA_asm: hypothetical protein HUJ06_019421 [Nelumbo nucifera]
MPPLQAVVSMDGSSGSSTPGQDHICFSLNSDQRGAQLITTLLGASTVISSLQGRILSGMQLLVLHLFMGPSHTISMLCP